MITEKCPPPDWGTLEDEGDQRDAADIALAERVEYLLARATLVPSSQSTPEDTARLLRLCHELELPERETQRVLAAAHKARAQGPAGRAKAGP